MKIGIKHTLYLGLALVIEWINKRLERRFRVDSIRASDIATESIAGRITAPKLSAEESVRAEDIGNNPIADNQISPMPPYEIGDEGGSLQPGSITARNY